MRLPIKKGEPIRLPFMTGIPVYRSLKCVAPIKHHVHPVAADAGPTIGSICRGVLVAESEVIAGLAYRII